MQHLDLPGVFLRLRLSDFDLEPYGGPSWDTGIRMDSEWRLGADRDVGMWRRKGRCN